MQCRTPAGKAGPACNHTLAWQEQVLNRAHISYELKDRIYQVLSAGKDLTATFSELLAMQVSDDLIAALLEAVG